MPKTAGTADPETDELAQKYLTTKQVASLLHVKERKIYDLAAAGEIPGTRARGKWLFDREAIMSWLEGHNTDSPSGRRSDPPNVVLGSHDPLLEWSLRESNSGLASFLDGSYDGLERFERREVVDDVVGHCPVPGNDRGAAHAAPLGNSMPSAISD